MAGDPIRCDMREDFETLERSREEWDHAVGALSGPIYMTFDWLRTWWRFYGTDHALRIFIFRSGNDIVGLLPMYVETFGRRPLQVRVARLVGANLPPKTFNPPLHGARAREVLLMLCDRLLLKEQCTFLSIGPVSDLWPAATALQSLRASARTPGFPWAITRAVRGVQTRFALPETVEDYLQGIGSGERKKRMKRLRALQREHSVSWDVVDAPDAVEAEFDAFAQQHARQWAQVHRPGHFAAWPRALGYNRAQVAAQSLHRRVRFYRMRVDGETVASRYTFQFGDTIFSELPARSVGPTWDRLGIGAMSLLKFNEAAIEAGARFVDSGLGEYQHKSALGGEEIPVSVWRVSRAGTARAAAACFRCVSGGMLFAGQKIWYRRIQPRLPPLMRRGQSERWLRFDA